MTTILPRLAAGTAIVIAAVGPLFAASYGTAGDDRTARIGDLPRCEIAVRHAGGGLLIEPFVHTDRPATGHYTLRLESRGGSNATDLSQGGDFAVRAGSEEPLGRIGVAGGTYDVRLEVDLDGERLTCNERIRG